MNSVPSHPAPLLALDSQRVKHKSRDTLQTARYGARRILWKESSLPRVRSCGRKLNGECSDRVAVKLSDGVAGFSGIQSCGSPWSCPVCSQKIMAERAEDVQQAVSRWHEMQNRVVFLTLTMRHKKGQRLSDLWDGLSYGWSKVTSGRAWERDSELYGVWLPRTIKSGPNKGEIRHGHRINFVRAVEVTNGKNGWHVHIHALLFVRDGITDQDVRMLSESVYGRWATALARKGFGTPSQEHGIDTKLVRRSDSHALGDYFTKSVYVGRVKADGAGWEIAGGQVKTARGKNRTPFQILADIEAFGDADDLALWYEWEAASHGRRQLTWSNSLRDVLALGDELTDEEIAEREIGGDVVMFFDRDEWYGWLCWRSDRILQLVQVGCTKEQVLSVLLAERQRAA